MAGRTIVAGDIGGTHARFALAELAPGARPKLGEVRRYRVADHDGLASAFAAFRTDLGAVPPDAAAFGIAAPLDGPLLTFPNSGWKIDRARIAAELGLADLLLVND